MKMHMETLDHSYPTDPLSPFAMIHSEPQYGGNGDCSSPQFSPIHYDDFYSSPNNSSVEEESSFHHSPLSSDSSYSSSENPCLLSSLSTMSISSEDSSLFASPPPTELPSNPFILPASSARNNKNRTRRELPSSSSSNVSSRRSSAPVRSSSDSPAIRKDSFVYDVQLETDNVLLFVPDLDLVKSHLMFAVREEVDILKENIKELNKRITTLEYENTVLKQYASEETMSHLQSHRQ